MLTNVKLKKIVYCYWANRFNCNQEDFTHPGTQVIIEEDFDETDRVVLYYIDQMSVVRIAPNMAKRAGLTIGYDRELGSLMVAQLQKLIGGEYKIEAGTPLLDCYLYSEDFEPFAVPDDFSARQLFPENDKFLLLDFYGQCTAEDLDEADIFVGKPDPVIFGLFDGDKMIAYASHRYWDNVIADMGVLVHPNYRRLGLGKAVVSELCRWSIENDIVPMYRVFQEHVHSCRIQEALGFTEMVRIETLKLKKLDGK